MSECHNELKRHATMLGVVVSVEGGTVTTTRFGRPETIVRNGDRQRVGATTLDTEGGARLSSLVIHCVTCAETQWQP